MPTRVIVQSPDPEIGSLVRSLLEPYGYETHLATEVAETSSLARRHGPVDLVLQLDGTAASPELRSRLREIAPDFKLLSLPAPSGGGILLETTELTDLVEGVLASAGGGPRRPVVTVETLRAALIETVLTYSLLLEQFGFINGGNSRLVMEYSVRVARELGLSCPLTDEVALAALLQDIGIAKARGRARGKGDGAAEPGGIEEHPIQSANLIQRMKLPWRIRHIVLAHHEWYNGLGYPHGLRGREIPLGARILAVVNGFFSMISRRPNRAAISQGEAFEELRRQAGRQLDPEVVEVFLALMRDKAFHHSEPKRWALVASGDPEFSLLARARLIAAGIDAESRASSNEVLDRIREGPPDAVLLDTELADGSGLQVLYWMKQDPRLSRVPVLVVSPESGRGTNDFAAHDLGADDFLVKPVQPSTLASRLLAVIRRADRVARAALTQIHEGEGLRGSLDELSVPDLINLLNEGRKTATVTLRSGEREAWLTFDAGVVVHARDGDITGVDALRRLYAWRQGDFVIEHGAATAERTISGRMDLLLAEVAESVAESRRIETEVEAPPAPEHHGQHDRHRPAVLAAGGTEVSTRPLPDTDPGRRGDTDGIETRAIDLAAAGR